MVQHFETFLQLHDENYVVKFKCDKCNYQGVDKWNLNRHKIRKHKTQTVPTSASDVRGPSQANLPIINLGYRKASVSTICIRVVDCKKLSYTTSNLRAVYSYLFAPPEGGE